MCIALAIYNLDNDFGKPDLLLIDEPDAALHPSMSKKMIDIINKKVVLGNNIPTIITTHSPATVISAEGISIYEMEKNNSIPQKTTVQKAIGILTEEIPFLKISNEKRRQIFVESPYDVKYYEALTNIIVKLKDLSSQPIFIPARTTNGSNCTDVINIVNNLSNTGNDQVYGIIDWDIEERHNLSEKILILGDKDRYSIENYLLDPLYIAFLAIRENKLPLEYFGVNTISSYIQLTELTENEAQLIVNKVIQDLNLDSNNYVNYRLFNKWNLKITKEFNLKQGHELEKIYKSTNKYGFLNKYQKEYELKLDIIKKVISDFPELININLVRTFDKIK